MPTKRISRPSPRVVSIDEERIALGPLSTGHRMNARLAFVPVRPGSLVIEWMDQQGNAWEVIDDATGQLVGTVDEAKKKNWIDYKTGVLHVTLSKRVGPSVPVIATYDAEALGEMSNEPRCKRCGASPHSPSSRYSTVSDWRCLKCSAILCEHQVRESKVEQGGGKHYLVHEIFGPAFDNRGRQREECGPVIPREDAGEEGFGEGESVASMEKKIKAVTKKIEETENTDFDSDEEGLIELVNTELEDNRSKLGNMMEILREKFKGLK